jgi:hypothetical protein
MRHGLILALALAGCAGDFAGGDDGNVTDAGGTNDSAPAGCAIAYDPIDPVASPVLPIRAYLVLQGATGFPTFTWTVYFGSTMIPFDFAASDESQISFIAATPGSYQVHVNISGAPQCPSASVTINVAAPGANNDVFRLRAVPSPTIAPPQETFIQVKGGADVTRAIALDSGIAANGTVINSATNGGITAYLKFMPRSMPTAFTEQFSTSSGSYGLRLLPLDHDVLVIPGVPGLAPKLVPWTAIPTTSTLTVGPGTAVTGTVRNPAGNGFGGAKVQLYAGGVPSTLGTTAADGSFSVRTDFPASATQVTVKVTPPAASGLPRLEATSAFNLASALNISYAPGLIACDLANVPVRRAAANQPNAQVSIVGSLAGVAGTINGINATNTVRVTATSSGSGTLPSMLVPRGSLFAVTEVSTMDHAVSAINTSTCSVAQIDAPVMTTINGTTKKDDGTVIGGVRVEAEPTGVLALAGVSPVHLTSSSTGGFALPLAGGGRYNVRFTDPQQRAAPLVATDVASGGVPTNAALAKALAISGTVSVVNNTNPVIGASVQVLCATCSGLEVARPIAETATDAVSKYRIAVPDPGTM